MGHALSRAPGGDVQALRRRPGPVPEGWGRVPPALLRYADEQTVVGVAAVFTAIERLGRGPEGFASWGVVAAPRFLGRASLAHALGGFAAEGVWGTSPHLIPHFALHSPAGTISVALGLHGPNLGAGGGLHGAAEGFLAALTWLATGVVPGVWLVLSGWSPELTPDGGAGAAPDVECQALALALVAAGSAHRAAHAPLPHSVSDRAAPDQDRAVGSQCQSPGSIPGGRLAVRVASEAASQPAPAPVDLVALAEGLERPGAPATRIIATDSRGRLRVELATGTEE